MSVGPYVAKMFFLQFRQMKVFGYTGVVSDAKTSKLTLCFSVLLL